MEYYQETALEMEFHRFTVQDGLISVSFMKPCPGADSIMTLVPTDHRQFSVTFHSSLALCGNKALMNPEQK